LSVSIVWNMKSGFVTKQTHFWLQRRRRLRVLEERHGKTYSEFLLCLDVACCTFLYLLLLDIKAVRRILWSLDYACMHA
jgi:hypothetical protein